MSAKNPESVEDAFRAMRDLFNDKARWAKGSFAKTKTGRTVTPSSPDAFCFCLLGAKQHLIPGTATKDLHLFSQVATAMGQSVGIMGCQFGHSVPLFNDANYTTIEDVREFLDINIMLAHAAGV